MTEVVNYVERSILLPPMLAERLSQLAHAQQISEDVVVARALDMLFRLTEMPEDDAERQDWSLLSTDSLSRVWDNDEDALYDNWRAIYNVPAG